MTGYVVKIQKTCAREHVRIIVQIVEIMSYTEDVRIRCKTSGRIIVEIVKIMSYICQDML